MTLQWLSHIALGDRWVEPAAHTHNKQFLPSVGVPGHFQILFQDCPMLCQLAAYSRNAFLWFLAPDWGQLMGNFSRKLEKGESSQDMYDPNDMPEMSLLGGPQTRSLGHCSFPGSTPFTGCQHLDSSQWQVLASWTAFCGFLPHLWHKFHVNRPHACMLSGVGTSATTVSTQWHIWR